VAPARPTPGGIATPARLHQPFLAACLLFAAATGLPLLLWRAGGEGDLLTLAWEGQREGALDRHLAASCRVLDAKNRALAELIDGRITLREAATRFRELNAQLEKDGEWGVIRFRVVSGEEALCRNVLAWAEAELWNHPDRSAPAEVLARLKAEYRQQFGHDPLLAYAPPFIPGV
jgi:hypothetical protein